MEWLTLYLFKSRHYALSQHGLKICSWHWHRSSSSLRKGHTALNLIERCSYVRESRDLSVHMHEGARNMTDEWTLGKGLKLTCPKMRIENDWWMGNGLSLWIQAKIARDNDINFLIMTAIKTKWFLCSICSAIHSAIPFSISSSRVSGSCLLSNWSRRHARTSGDRK